MELKHANFPSIKTRFLGAICCLGITALSLGFAKEPETNIPNNPTVKWVENHMSDFESKVRSTLMFGGSSPVSFNGEARLHIRHHHLFDHPAYMHKDRDYVNTGWEGNESMIRIGMIVRPSRNTVLWSKIGFQNTMPGRFRTLDTIVNRPKEGAIEALYPHDKSLLPANIHEDMSAGMAIRSKAASGWLRMGAILWTEASPLTIWRAQPRTFAWEYMPFEVEQPIARYYEYNIAKGEKTGRAAWNKKPFQGIQLESINLPWDLYTNFIYGTHEKFDKFNTVYADPGDDVGYTDLTTSAKARGKGNRFTHLVHGRIAKDNLFSKVKGSLNIVKNIIHDDFLFNSANYKKPFNLIDKQPDGKIFFTESFIASAELRGNLNDKLLLHTDIAISMLDSTIGTWNITTKPDSGKRFAKHHNARGATFGIFGSLKSSYGIPLTTNFGFFPKGFSSPFSFVGEHDAFYAYGANLLGSGGVFGEGRPYTDNMTGLSFIYAPDIGYGHLKIGYGQHMQLKEGPDVLFFPYRLHGHDLYSFFQSPYTRWGTGTLDAPLEAEYDKRIGDESLLLKGEKLSQGISGNRYPSGPYAGGLRSSYLSMSEGFVPYRDTAQANKNLHRKNQKSPLLKNFSYYTVDSTVPVSKKYTFNFDIDAAYNFGPMVGYGNDLLLGAYFAINSVSTSFQPVAFGAKEDKVLLWSFYFRFEPAIAISDKLYILGVLGYENWRSDLAYIRASQYKSKKSPIDYRDFAYGIGFDWDIAPRVGLHGRWKMMHHRDKEFKSNNWNARLLNAEIKMWF